MKQQQAFAGNEKMLKGGLHCHTTRSDGEGSPAAVEQLHLTTATTFSPLPIIPATIGRIISPTAIC